ncbi:hypothetical protein PMAYCL1PPCAC_29499, partial [Pristionchus mayeri]
QRISRTTTIDEEEELEEVTARSDHDAPSIVEKTAISDGRFVPTDSDKDVLRERFTLDATLTRYARWGRTRIDLLVYGALIMASQMYLALLNGLTTVAAFKTRQNMEVQTPLCWCDNSFTAGEIQRYLEEIRPNIPVIVMKVGFLTLAFTSPLWERWLSRRTSLLISLSLSLICTLVIHQTADVEDSALIRNCAWTIEHLLSGVVHIISYSSFVEVLPKIWRVFGAGIALLADTFADMEQSIKPFQYQTIKFAGIIIIYRIIALALVILLMKVPISNLIVKGKYSEVDDILCEEEIKLMAKKSAKEGKSDGTVGVQRETDSSSGTFSEGDLPPELKLARMITDDLAYRDDDDYTPLEFFRKLPHSNVFYLLCVGFLSAAVSGLMDRLTVIYLGRMYFEGEILLATKVSWMTL